MLENRIVLFELIKSKILYFSWFNYTSKYLLYVYFFFTNGTAEVFWFFFFFINFQPNDYDQKESFSHITVLCKYRFTTHIRVTPLGVL